MKSRLLLLASLPLVLAAAHPAVAGFPPIGPNSSVPPCLTIVGHNGAGVPDPLGRFPVIIRDLANNPVPGVIVTLDLSQCSDIALCAQQNDPAAVVNCAQKTVSKITAADGSVTFIVMGCALNAGASPGIQVPQARVFADGFLLASVWSPVLDQSGCDGIGANDLSTWLSDFFSGQYFVRSDYDYSGYLGANDLSLWITAFGLGGSVAGCSSIGGACP